MNFGDLITNVKNATFEDGVHRNDAFIKLAINEGYKLVAVTTLFDERRTTINIEGSRNYNPLPFDSTAECFTPLYIANSHTGSRINPVKLTDFEFYSSAWEGMVDSSGNSLYYVLLSPYHINMTSLVLCPIQNIGKTQLTMIGAFIPIAMSASTDIPRFDEQFHDVLFNYAMFYVLLSEPGMSVRAFDYYKDFISRTNALITSIKSRFPSGRDVEPWPVELSREEITEKDQKQQQENQNEGK